jgi:hypothetical protein
MVFLNPSKYTMIVGPGYHEATNVAFSNPTDHAWPLSHVIPYYRTGVSKLLHVQAEYAFTFLLERQTIQKIVTLSFL